MVLVQHAICGACCEAHDSACMLAPSIWSSFQCVFFVAKINQILNRFIENRSIEMERSPASPPFLHNTRTHPQTLPHTSPAPSLPIASNRRCQPSALQSPRSPFSRRYRPSTQLCPPPPPSFFVSDGYHRRPQPPNLSLSCCPCHPLSSPWSRRCHRCLAAPPPLPTAGPLLPQPSSKVRRR